jgi:hypothetical protein
MSDAAGGRPGGELRASDAEREAVADRLRVAAGEGRLTLEELTERMDSAYDARTRGDLERLLADLPDPAHPVSLQPLAPAVPAPPPPEARSVRRSLVAIMGGSTLSGRTRVGPRTTVVSVMGGVEIDLNDAVLEAGEVVFDITCVMGGVEVRVPDGVHVVNDVFAVMGGVDVRSPGEAPPPGAPVVHLRGFVLMGGIDVKRGRKKRARDRLHQALGHPPPPPPPTHLGPG